MSEPPIIFWAVDPDDSHPYFGGGGSPSEGWGSRPWTTRSGSPLIIGSNVLRSPFAGGGSPLRVGYESSESRRDPDAEEAKNRHDLLLQLVDAELLKSKFEALFASPEVARWRLRLNASAPQPLREYVAMFAAISDLYALVVSLLHGEYFAQRWLQNSPIRLQGAHELRVISISRASPEDVKVEGLSAGLKALGDALSIGKQYQEIRTAGEKVREAKAAARKIELEVEDAERDVRVANAAEAEILRLTIAQRRADMRMLQLKLEEEELRLRALRRKDIDESLELLRKHAPVLEKLPEAMRSQVLVALTRSVSAVHDSPFDILEYTEADPKQILDPAASAEST